MGDRKDQEPQFGRLDDLGENTSPVGLRSDAPEEETANAPGGEPNVSSASGLTTRDQPVEAQPTIASGTPGEALRQAREHHGLDTMTLAQRTRLSRKTIEDLEFNRFSEIPPTYVRGYLRAVARELDADGAAWVRAYENLGYAEPTVGPMTKGSTAGTVKRSRGGLGYLLILLAVLGVLAFGAYIWLADNGENVLERIPGVSWLGSSPPTGPVDGDAVEPPEAAVGEAAAEPEPLVELTFDPVPEPESVGSARVDSVAEVARPAPAASIDSTETGSAESGAREQGGLPEQAVPASAAIEGRAAAAPSEAAAVVLPAGRGLVGLSFQETSWAEIRSASGVIELRGVFDRGDRRSAEVELPARVVLGNAPGVALDLNGVAVDLETHTRGDRTARFDLDANR